jgi:hypothetical protein
MEKIGKVRYIGAIMAAVMLMLTLSACGGDSGGGATSSKSNVDLLKEAVTNQKTLKSYHINMNIKQGDATITLSGDVDAANKKFNVIGNLGGQEAAVIKMSDTEVYGSTDKGTTWAKVPPESASSFDSLLAQFNNGKPENVDKAKDDIKDGTPKDDTIDGTATRHMTVDAQKFDPSGNGTGTLEGTNELWVSTNDKPTLRQLKVVGKDKGQDVAGTITWSKVDEAVTIKAPDNVITP